MVDRDRCHLYELWNVWYDQAHGQWYAGSGAFFDMNTNNRRPETWTSADAAGLAILPGLVRYDEVYATDPTGAYEIPHAFRVTVRRTNGHVFPASHTAGSTAGALPMGAPRGAYVLFLAAVKANVPTELLILATAQLSLQ